MSLDKGLWASMFVLALAGALADQPGRWGKVTAPKPQDVRVVARSAPLLAVDGKQFKDLDKNGVLDPYEDWRLAPEVRAADLLSRMTLEEKAGMMMIANHGGFVGPQGELLDEPTREATAQALTLSPDLGDIPGISVDDRPSPRELILKRNVRWIATKFGGIPPANAARWTNSAQELAEGSRLGIPIAFGGDPQQTTHRKPGGGLMGPETLTYSAWPDQIGFGAIADPAVVHKFGEIAAAEYRAEGVTFTVNPIADVATDPRWNRIPGTFGSDAPLAAKLVYAYIQGFQGPRITPRSVLCITKHFPGDGPVKDGLDPHNPYGKQLAYPANNLDYHLLPFRAAIRAGSASIMGTYGIPAGIDNVGANFSRKVMTGLLRDKLGYSGIVVTDWLRAMPWGVESLSQLEREHRLLDAGIDQLGGEHDSSFIVQLVRSGTVPESRIDASVKRILLPLFGLGLFEDPYVDPDQATRIVGNPNFIASGLEAQRRAIVVLKNAGPVLPMRPGIKLFVVNLAPAAFSAHATLVPDPAQADVVMIKVNAPYVSHKGGGNFFKETHEGTVAYAGSDNADDLQQIRRLVGTGKPVVVVMSMERPAVLSEFISSIPGMVATFGSSDQALAEVLFGRHAAEGKLPFDLPRDMQSVLTHKEDAAHDFHNPLYPFGFGLYYPAVR